MNRFLLKMWIGIAVFIVVFIIAFIIAVFCTYEKQEVTVCLFVRGFVYDKDFRKADTANHRTPLPGVASLLLFDDPAKLTTSELDHRFMRLKASYNQIPAMGDILSGNDGTYRAMGSIRFETDLTLWNKISPAGSFDSLKDVWIVLSKDGYKNSITKLDMDELQISEISDPLFNEIPDVFLGQ